MLGNGAFGYVFKAYDENHDRYVAIKRSPKVGNKTSREMEVLLSMQGEENVIQLLDFFYSLDTNHRLVQNSVFEFCDQTLEDLIKDFCDKKKSIPIEKVKSYTKQAVNGLANMHRAGIAHRDLKPENILMKGEEVKICDLGSSKFLDTKLWRNTPYVVSRYYRAPELIMASTHYTTSIDIWALGSILFELLTRQPLFPGDSEGLQILEHICMIGFPSEREQEELKKIIDPKVLMLL